MTLLLSSSSYGGDNKEDNSEHQFQCRLHYHSTDATAAIATTTAITATATITTTTNTTRTSKQNSSHLRQFYPSPPPSHLYSPC